MRQFSGKVLLRMPADLHRDLAEEAFRTGKSLNQLCLEALLSQRALKHHDPWRTVAQLWRVNKKTNPSEVVNDVQETIREVRRGRRRQHG